MFLGPLYSALNAPPSALRYEVLLRALSPLTQGQKSEGTRTALSPVDLTALLWLHLQ